MDLKFYLDMIEKQWAEVAEEGCPAYLQMAIISVTDVAKHEGFDGPRFCDSFNAIDNLAHMLSDKLKGHRMILTSGQIIQVYNKDIEFDAEPEE